MTYAEHWREHCLPRCALYARERAIEVAFGTVYQPDGWTLGPLREVTFSEAMDASMAHALRWGADRLTDPVFRDLEAYLANQIAATIETTEALRGR